MRFICFPSTFLTAGNLSSGTRIWLKQELRRKHREGPEGGLDVSGLSSVPSSGKNEPAGTRVCLGIQI